MESSEENRASISETLCPKMLVCLAKYPDKSHDFTNLICIDKRVAQVKNAFFQTFDRTCVNGLYWTKMAIPVVDFSAMGLQNKNQPWAENSNAVKDLADELYNACSTVGFVYLKNHGIPQEMIDSIFVEMDKFFALSDKVKTKYKREYKFCRDGWNSFEAESLNSEGPPGYKETLDLNSIYEPDFRWPNEEIPNFQSNITRTYETMTELSFRVLSVMAIGLQLKHDAFAHAFEKAGTLQGETMLRYSYYPTITDMSNVKPGQLRCGEHTDWGAITLLIQDDVGGLEIRNVEGKFVPAPPIEGTIVVNIGDMMERWTADKLKSTVHRVLIPEEQIKRRHRRSLALFFNPDVDAVITCMDGSNKYPPVTSGEWVQMKQNLAHK
ncbi:unnamed protein product [Porites evermanni]|uniref:Fe2OG dioxygenase domain-containing protein n=1 Tax=Porites evermanni TaxID=104178 RepID=A0ABN8T1G3_9CNID|nr:unnamed protein product [Porites evermanni]